MHRSRLSTFVIDCKSTDLDGATRFWKQAFGREDKRTSAEFDDRYRLLLMRDDEPNVIVQLVDHDSRVHLDIEADDLDAEVARLEKLGAKRIGFVKRWWVMEAPTGHRFCVVNPQRGPLSDANANRW